jgi:hypothetical protein
LQVKNILEMNKMKNKSKTKAELLKELEILQEEREKM